MYIESLFILDFWIDFLILLATSLILKRKTKIFNIVLGSFVGSVSVIILFLNIATFQAFILKVYFSIIMILISFYYRDLKYTLINLVTFYFISIMLGGFFYFLKLESLYSSMIFLFIISPIIIYIYIRQATLERKKQKLFYNTDIYIGKKVLNLVGFMDSGNNLIYKNNLVIITNQKNIFRRKKIYIAYNTISSYGLLECIKVDKVVAGNKEFSNVLLGFSENFNIDGADVLLHNKMGE